MLVYWALSIVGVYAQADVEAFRAFVKAAQEKFELPSLSLAIVQNGEIVFSDGFGSTGVPTVPDGKTQYAIASLSKAFTAASIGMLVDEGKLDWDDRVVDILPWFQMHDPYVTEHLTVEDLLCHRSGLITFDGDLLWYASDYSRKEIVERIRRRPPTYEFRARFGYQNIMFITAGEVIEAASGISWDDFVSTRILQPLQMTRTTSKYAAFSGDKNKAQPTLKGEIIPMLSYDNSGATAALSSCTEDMSKWASFWLNEGVHEGDTLLSEASIRRIWSIHTPLNVGRFDEKNGTHFKGYGLGWFLMDYQGKKVVHHGGGLPGYITKFALVPEEEIGIIAMTNDMSSAPTMLMYAAIDWLLGNEYQFWSNTFYDFKVKGDERKADKEQERLKTKIEEPQILDYSKYVGTFIDEMYGKAKVKKVGNDLEISLLPSKAMFTGKMSPWADHAFRFEHNDPFLPYGVATFEVEGDKVKGFTIDLPNYDFHFDKLRFSKIAE